LGFEVSPVKVVMALASLVFVLVVIAGLWLAWDGSYSLAEKILFSLLLLSLVWVGVATWGRVVSFPKVGDVDSKDMLQGARPQDPSRLAAWRWSRQFRYAMVSLLICLAVLSLILWIQSG
jgi:hypothetical protein